MNNHGIQNIRNILKDHTKGSYRKPILILPTHRSYADFLLMSYALFSNDIKLPFVAAGEDFKRIPLVGRMLKKVGGFYMKRKWSSKTDKVYATLFKSYLQQVRL